ncbi:hypothetical protein GA0074695_2903 [Micromonospora viridifaciens]|uniref:Uncharacterized protein n=1 Tax=Micromonospora viridifaciens TaxID=1881 RepID=A0A1C4X0D6_MICVI|nr:hypothetical protein GA0074695_2903 [Micromonospora viridifaciens]
MTRRGGRWTRVALRLGLLLGGVVVAWGAHEAATSSAAYAADRPPAAPVDAAVDLLTGVLRPILDTATPLPAPDAPADETDPGTPSSGAAPPPDAGPASGPASKPGCPTTGRPHPGQYAEARRRRPPPGHQARRRGTAGAGGRCYPPGHGAGPGWSAHPGGRRVTPDHRPGAGRRARPGSRRTHPGDPATRPDPLPHLARAGTSARADGPRARTPRTGDGPPGFAHRSAGQATTRSGAPDQPGARRRPGLHRARHRTGHDTGRACLGTRSHPDGPAHHVTAFVPAAPRRVGRAVPAPSERRLRARHAHPRHQWIRRVRHPPREPGRRTHIGMDAAQPGRAPLPPDRRRCHPVPLAPPGDPARLTGGPFACRPRGTRRLPRTRMPWRPWWPAPVRDDAGNLPRLLPITMVTRSYP